MSSNNPTLDKNNRPHGAITYTIDNIGENFIGQRHVIRDLQRLLRQHVHGLYKKDEALWYSIVSTLLLHQHLVCQSFPIIYTLGIQYSIVIHATFTVLCCWVQVALEKLSLHGVSPLFSMNYPLLKWKREVQLWALNIYSAFYYTLLYIYNHIFLPPSVT